jgi:hypothetical protein
VDRQRDFVDNVNVMLKNDVETVFEDGLCNRFVKAVILRDVTPCLTTSFAVIWRRRTPPRLTPARPIREDCMTVLERPAAEEATSERIRQATQRLSAEFGEHFTPQDVERFAEEWLAAYKTAPVIEFLPLLVERFTRERLLTSMQGQPAQ